MAKTAFFDVLLATHYYVLCPLVHREIAQFIPEKKVVFFVIFFRPYRRVFCVCRGSAANKRKFTQKNYVKCEISFMRQTTAHFFYWFMVFFQELNWVLLEFHPPALSPPHDDPVELKMLHVINDLRRPQTFGEYFIFDIFMLDNESTIIKCIGAVHPAINFPITFSFLCRPRHVELTSSCVSFQKVTCMRLESIYHSRRAGGSRKLTQTWHIISQEESWLSAFARVVKIIKLRALN